MNISEALKKQGHAIIETLFDDIKQGSKAQINEVENYVDKLIEEISQKPEGELCLLQTDTLESYMLHHSINVALLSLVMAYKMEIPKNDLRDIGIAALLHDIGKINTPVELQWMQFGSSAYEKVTLAEHPLFGAHWMSQYTVISDQVESMIKNHHETFDGQGYPEGVVNRDLPVSVHILSICNYYDYLISAVAEKPPVDSRTACFIISRESGKMFSHKIVVAFLSHMGPVLMDGPLFQKTALVLLDTKEVAAIAKTTGFGDTQPDIIVLTDREGKKLQRPLTINLKRDGSREIVKLLKT